MRAQITDVRFHGYHRNEDIAIYRWRLDTGEQQGESDRAAMVAWVDQGNELIVAVDGAWQQVGVVRMPGVAPYLAAHQNGQWTDGLLRLPMF
jgi:hypothetical protein